MLLARVKRTSLDKRQTTCLIKDLETKASMINDSARLKSLIDEYKKMKRTTGMLQKGNRMYFFDTLKDPSYAIMLQH